MLKQKLKASMELLHPLLILILTFPKCNHGQELLKPSYHFMTRVESGFSVFIPFVKMQDKALSGLACITCLNFRTVTRKGKEGNIRKEKIIVFYHKEREENGN